jgi:hypoxanthine phosphoribosyltransferase
MTVLSSQQEIDILITEAEIAARTNNLARQITDHYKGTEQLVVVGLLRGSFVFIADLVRRLALPVEVDFMTVSSYGNDTVSSRQVRIIQDLETVIKNRDVLIVEDIVDTGHTLSQVQKILLTRSPKSLSICTLLNKPSRREVDVDVDWVGFDIPDAFVIGYGIDYAQQGRNLPHIGVVKAGEIADQLFQPPNQLINQEKPPHSDR